MITNGDFYSFKKTENDGYDTELQRCIEETCEYCIKNASESSYEKINKPIMMLGKIQSGKTRAYTGLISLAFDNDFNMVFILTKNSTALVQQTVTRMQKEFKPFIDKYEVTVSDIMKTNNRIRGYQLEQDNIIVAKKESKNMDRVLDFITHYSISENKKCLIIDDEADTTGIGYSKVKNSDEYTLRAISSKVNRMRGTLNGCVFVEVTATPYALYLQPDFEDTDRLQPIKPMKTVLVPYGKDYIGGDYYFGTNENSCACYLFEPMLQEEDDMVADQKRKGKKSKIEDRRSFKEEEILIRKDKLPVFKMGIINFIIGSITLKNIYRSNDHYAFVIHTATQKNAHVNLQNVAEIFLNQIRERSKETIPIITELLKTSYEDIKASVTASDYEMSPYSIVETEFYNIVDREYYSIDVVNSDKDVDALLDGETGELKLTTPCSIFVGGQVLDRGVTIKNMIGFYYGRNPKSMQEDTVMQHSRMYGYRKKLLPVTRFYTTERIHSNMKKITEIDDTLREDIKKSDQENGIYFITRKAQDRQYGPGSIKSCSPSKICVSDILLLKPTHRVLPVGFEPVNKVLFSKINSEIEQKIRNLKNIDDGVYEINLKQAEELAHDAYRTIQEEDNGLRFVEEADFITSLGYCCKNNDIVFLAVHRNLDIKKYKKSKNGGMLLQDAPDSNKIAQFKEGKRMAIDSPSLLLAQENGNASWNNRPFWWPILVIPKNIPNTIYASKESGETIRA